MVNGHRLSLQLYLRQSLALILGWLDWLAWACCFSSKAYSFYYNGREESVTIGDKSILYTCAEKETVSHRNI